MHAQIRAFAQASWRGCGAADRGPRLPAAVAVCDRRARDLASASSVSICGTPDSADWRQSRLRAAPQSKKAGSLAEPGLEACEERDEREALRQRECRVAAVARQHDVLLALVHVGHQAVLADARRRHCADALAGLLVDGEQVRPVVGVCPAEEQRRRGGERGGDRGGPSWYRQSRPSAAGCSGTPPAPSRPYRHAGSSTDARRCSCRSR